MRKFPTSVRREKLSKYGIYPDMLETFNKREEKYPT